MKLNWIEPSIKIENFQPDEYVAACYKLACHRGSEGNRYGISHWDYSNEVGNVSHSVIGTPNTCGDASANRVITDDGGIFQSVGEFNGEQGWLDGEMTDIINMDQNANITPGDIVFWYTESGSGKNYRKWNHWGVVQQQDRSHPNHS